MVCIKVIKKVFANMENKIYHKPLLRSVKGYTPSIHSSVFLAETAQIIGDVHINKDCSIWHGAVLRGDVSSITYR